MYSGSAIYSATSSNSKCDSNDSNGAHSASRYICKAKECGLLFANAHAPARLVCKDGPYKLYDVYGTTFRLDAHYELLTFVGLGAYGMVCAAVDLRLILNDDMHSSSDNNNKNKNKKSNCDGGYYNP
uniref:Mitogen-activated protein kinase HOG1 n=1 Tax=Lygus hesperus TaxID=30085 RepID=A0A0A9XSS8_LYGHE